MGQEVLVLNSDYEPLNVCNLRRAVVLVYLGKADVLHTQAEEFGKDEYEASLFSAEGEIVARPSVVRLRSQVRRPLPERVGAPGGCSMTQRRIAGRPFAAPAKLSDGAGNMCQVEQPAALWQFVRGEIL